MGWRRGRTTGTPDHVWTEFFLRRIDQERPALNVPYLDLCTGSHPLESANRLDHRHRAGSAIFKRHRNHDPELVADQHDHAGLEIQSGDAKRDNEIPSRQFLDTQRSVTRHAVSVQLQNVNCNCTSTFLLYEAGMPPCIITISPPRLRYCPK